MIFKRIPKWGMADYYRWKLISFLETLKSAWILLCVLKFFAGDLAVTIALFCRKKINIKSKSVLQKTKTIF